MSSIAVTGSASGTGVVSLVAPVTNTNRTLTLPDATGTVATAESTLTQFNATGSAPVYACRAWVNFNGTGTVAIRASGNVSSITDNGTGDYTVNFTSAMPDANYSVLTTSTGTFAYQLVGYSGIKGDTATGASIKTTTSIGVAYGYGNSAGFGDSFEMNVSIFR